MKQTAIPCLLMRGGTSKGPFFLASNLPSDVATRDQVLLVASGSPDKRQIDGVGGAHPQTSRSQADCQAWGQAVSPQRCDAGPAPCGAGPLFFSARWAC